MPETRGGKRSTSWGKGQAPPKKKGVKHKATVLKEKIGLSGWDALADFVNTDGADKLVKEMKTLKGKNYVYALNAIAEYIKPKLNRTTHANDEKNPLPAPVIMLPPGAVFSFPASEADVDLNKKP